MFTIVVSEKGGAERRETFDKNEINVGRVQGNELMLPKGNVSKHHARLLFRDGRFIVTDLKSTNGTYVNGRKISQATIVRDGDKIYIGDFVLRLETGQVGQPVAAPDARTVGVTSSAPRAASVGPPPLPPHALAAAAAPPPLRVPEPQLSHYPLERDPDSESAPDLQGGAPEPKVPGPPKLPQSSDSRPRVTTARMSERTSGASERSRPGTPGPSPVVVGSRPMPRETPERAARRLALIALVDRVGDAIDLEALLASPTLDPASQEQVEVAVREQLKAMLADGEAPKGTDSQLLARDALDELVGIGPIGALLEDDETSEIHVARPDHVALVKNGHATLAEASFTSAVALGRVVARLAHQSGQSIRPGETILERRLAGGASMIAIAPPSASGWVLTIRKRRRVEASLDELLRAGAMSRPMAAFLEACMGARANVLVVGSGADVVSSMIAALASAAVAGERIAVLQGGDDIAVGHAQVLSLVSGGNGARGEDVLRAASRLASDRLVVASLAGAVAVATIDAIGEGSEGVLAGMCAPSLRHGLGRLSAMVALACPGASIDAAREAVGEAFEVGVEAGRTADGRLRVLRVAELAGGDQTGVVTRDVFLSSGEGSQDGFVATGMTPRLVHEFAARGIKLDATLFKRAR